MHPKTEEVFRKIHLVLNHLVSRLKSNKYFEFGDDPAFVRNVRQDLFEIEKILLNDISPLCLREDRKQSENRLYYACLSSIRDSQRYVKNVSRQGRGSRQNTLDFTDKLNDCIVKFREFSHSLQVPIFPYEFMLNALEEEVCHFSADNIPGVFTQSMPPVFTQMLPVVFGQESHPSASSGQA